MFIHQNNRQNFPRACVTVYLESYDLILFMLLKLVPVMVSFTSVGPPLHSSTPLLSNNHRIYVTGLKLPPILHISIHISSYRSVKLFATTVISVQCKLQLSPLVDFHGRHNNVNSTQKGKTLHSLLSVK